MSDDQPKTRVEFFPNPVVRRAVDADLTRSAARRHAEQSQHLVNAENTVRVRHGGTWMNPGLPETRNAKVQTHSASLSIAFDEIVSNDLDVIHRCVETLSRSMADQLAAMAYGFIQEVCDGTGNVVSAAPDVPFHETFYTMVERIEYTVGRDGTVSRPALHVNSEGLKKLRKALDDAPPGFKERFDALDAAKERDALMAEAARISRFAKPKGEQ